MLSALAVCALAYSTNYAEEAKKKEPAVDESDAPRAAHGRHAAGDDEEFVDPDAPGVDPEKIDWSRVDWRRRLSRKQYAIMREADTERPGTGKYWKLFKSGQYNCAGCGLPLFDSTSKFDAHCGWPSFDRTVDKKSIVEIVDDSLGMRRIEIRCRRCDSHLGHVFDDGPTETGLRYCLNSASLNFEPAEDAVVKRKKGAKHDHASHDHAADDDEPKVDDASDAKAKADADGASETPAAEKP